MSSDQNETAPRGRHGYDGLGSDQRCPSVDHPYRSVLRHRQLRHAVERRRQIVLRHRLAHPHHAAIGLLLFFLAGQDLEEEALWRGVGE